ncbi:MULTISPECIES: hypothetical protein [unclassified Caballeronia]|uniref:GFA family protein n=1 Tax=unclassified Caballeronia TaxID=2646786 RepID=UPI002860E578|nr:MULTISPECIES: hypothetical protein [unclassified Caballeronia]MDR5741289.1 hypothetical protein [Caballeronia sp. LZ016]MDR5807187.1 hypothetical protein [Caballeronia sp. LZ019]
MNHPDVYRARCICGGVRFTLNGEPAGVGYQGRIVPLDAFVLWTRNALHVTRGIDDIGAYRTSPRDSRHWCRSCGGYLFTEHPRLGLVDVHASILGDARCEEAARLMDDMRIAYRDS